MSFMDIVPGFRLVRCSNIVIKIRCLWRHCFLALIGWCFLDSNCRIWAGNMQSNDFSAPPFTHFSQIGPTDVQFNRLNKWGLFILVGWAHHCFRSNNNFPVLYMYVTFTHFLPILKRLLINRGFSLTYLMHIRKASVSRVIMENVFYCKLLSNEY